MITTIRQVISGAQTGVDIASLRVAKRLGFPTGGTMPKNFRTLIGPKPEWAKEFGLVEHELSMFPPRTRKNVEAAHLTIHLAVDFDTAGEVCTQNAIRAVRRANARIQLVRHEGIVRGAASFHASSADIDRAIVLIRETRKLMREPIIVNFAGNSEESARGIERAAEAFVERILAPFRSAA